MTRTENTATDDRNDQQESSASAHVTVDDNNDSPPGDETASWFATSALRIGLALIGLVLLLVALGQIAGVDFLGMFADVLATEVGRWLVVAVVACSSSPSAFAASGGGTLTTEPQAASTAVISSS